MKKRIIPILILLAFILSTNVYADDADLKNIAPEAGFSMSVKKPVDVLIVTDYTGAKLADLQNKLLDMRTQGLAEGNDIKYTLYTHNMYIGTQQSQIPINCYSRNIYFSYTQNNINGWEAPATLNKTDLVSYEYCELEPGQSFPTFVKGNSITMTTEYTEYQGMGWFYIGKYAIFYNPSNYAATKSEYRLIEQYGNSHDNTDSGFYVRQYSNFSYVLSNSWELSSSYYRPVTSNISALDFSKLDSKVFRPDSSKYVLMVSDNSDTVTYNKSFGEYYSFSAMRSDNLGKFIADNEAHAYAVCDSSIVDIKLSNPTYGVTYNSDSIKQDKSIKDIVKSSMEGRIFAKDQLQNALNTIAGINRESESQNIDLIIATDKSTAEANNFKNALASKLDSRISLNAIISSADDKSLIDYVDIPEFKDIKKEYLLYNAGNVSKTSFILTEDNELYAKGKNCARSVVYSYGQDPTYDLGLFGNTISDYDKYTIIMDNVKDFSIGKYRYRTNSINCQFNMLVVLKTDGTLWVAGANFSQIIRPWDYTGNTGLVNKYYANFKKIEGLSNVKEFVTYGSIDSSSSSTQDSYRDVDYFTFLLVALTNDGSVYYLGDDKYAYFVSGQGTLITPYKDGFLANVDHIEKTGQEYDSGGWTLFTIKGNDVHLKGAIRGLTNDVSGNQIIPYKLFTLPANTTIADLYCYNNYTLFIKDRDNRLYSYYVYQSNISGSSNVSSPTPTLICSNVKDFYAGPDGYYCYIIDFTGDIYYWGIEYYIPAAFLGKPSYNYNLISAPTKCTVISNIDEVYPKCPRREGAVYFKKKDDSLYVGGWSVYNYHMFKGPDSNGNYTARSYYTPVQVIPDSSLNIKDFCYQNYEEKVCGVTLSKDIIRADLTNLGKDISLYKYRAMPVYGVNTNKVMSSTLRPGSQRYFIYISDNAGADTLKPYGQYFPFGSLKEEFMNYLNSNGFNIYAVCPEEALNVKMGIPNTRINVQTHSLNDLFNSAVADSANYSSKEAIIQIILEKNKIKTNGTSNAFYVVAGEDVVEYKMMYNDLEADPKFAEQWQYVHDDTVYLNNNGKLATSGQWVASPITNFSQVGKYSILFRARDNPKNDNRFDAYRLWSNMSQPFVMYAHRRPIADFSITARPSAGAFLPVISDTSYDLDHTDREDKGIVERRWRWKESTAATWNNGLPASLATGRKYSVELQVKDLEGAWSFPTIKTVDTGSVNLPPIVDANPQSLSSDNNIAVVVTADDLGENDFSRTNYQWSKSTSRPGGTWSTQTSKTFTTTLTTEGTWYLHMEAFDNSGQSFYRYRGPYVLTKNRAPVVSISINQGLIYDKDDVKINMLPVDPDGDETQLVLQSSKDGGAWTTIFTKGGCASSQVQNHTMQNVSYGSYRLRVVATDPGGLSASAETSFTTLVLDVTGTVDPNPALAGEKVYFRCDTTGYAETCVIYLWNGDTVSLTPEHAITVHDNHWTGEYIVPLKTPDSTYNFIAMATKDARMDTAPLQLTIIGNIYDLVRPRIRESN